MDMAHGDLNTQTLQSDWFPWVDKGNIHQLKSLIEWSVNSN